MNIVIPDKCGECEHFIELQSGEHCCKKMMNMVASIGCADFTNCKVNAEDNRPEHCQYNKVILGYMKVLGN